MDLIIVLVPLAGLLFASWAVIRALINIPRFRSARHPAEFEDLDWTNALNVRRAVSLSLERRSAYQRLVARNQLLWQAQRGTLDAGVRASLPTHTTDPLELALIMRREVRAMKTRIN